jgi:hypothetical protein
MWLERVIGPLPSEKGARAFGICGKLFDIPFLAKMEHASLATMPKTQMLIFGNAPCIAAIFRPLATLSYEQAYCVWLVFSAAIYLTGLLMLVRGNRIAMLLALSTPTFTMETWISGQISIFAADFLRLQLLTKVIAAWVFRRLSSERQGHSLQ